jgi:hypothetical protein
MARTVRATQAALSKARKRRLAIDAERDERDRRVEQAAADVFVLLDERADAVARLTELDEQIGCAVRRIVAEGVTLVSVSALLELDLADVRNLAKASAKHISQGGPTAPATE